MKSFSVTALSLSNYKGIATIDLKMDPWLTVLTGSNGVGKTTILEALLEFSTHAWGYLNSNNSRYPNYNNPTDIARIGTDGASGKLFVKKDSTENVGEFIFQQKGSGISITSAPGSMVLDSTPSRRINNMPLIVYYDLERITPKSHFVRSDPEIHVKVHHRRRMDESTVPTARPSAAGGSNMRP